MDKTEKESLHSIIVVPTIRELSIEKFLEEWEDEFRDSKIIIVEDNPEKSFDLNHPNVDHYAWEDIERDLGEDAWIIPRRTDCIRSFGYWKAYQEQPDLILTLDDDCYPHDQDFIANHVERLSVGLDSAWIKTGSGPITRGFPYFNTARQGRCVLNHGMWTKVPDYDAPTQLAVSRLSRTFEPTQQTIPKGKYFPMCGMNVALRPEIVPAFYFLLMGAGYDYDRMGDIWAGIFVKKICDHLDFAVNSGTPLVEHSRASNVWSNLRKEAPTLPVNEDLWLAVDKVVLTNTTIKACYQELAEGLEMEGEYWEKLRRAMLIWAELFPDTEG